MFFVVRSVLPTLLLLIGEVTSYKLTISPEHVRVSWSPQSGPTPVIIACAADVPLTGCQFSWQTYMDRNNAAYNDRLIDLSQGAQSQVNSSYLDHQLVGYSYRGRGLEAGDCGITLKIWSNTAWMVGCRGRAAQGGWMYAWTEVFAHNNAPFHDLTVTPQKAIVHPGSNATFICRVGEALDHCLFYFPIKTIVFNKRADSTQATDMHGQYDYHGAGLSSGECGIRVNVKETHNGPAVCYLSKSVFSGMRFVQVIVAHAPMPPVLNVANDGNNIMASCTVKDSRPAPSIKWLLGDKILREDNEDDAAADLKAPWRWPWDKANISQNINHRIQPEDYGKVLRCVVSHPMLAQPLEASKEITIQQPEDVDRLSPRILHDISMSHPMVEPFTHSIGSILEILCHEYDVRASEFQNTSRPKDEVYELRLQEAKAAASAAELTLETALSHARAVSTADALLIEARKLSVEAAKVGLEVVKATLEVERSKAKVEVARAKEEEAWAVNAEEELQFERGRRNETLTQM